MGRCSVLLACAALVSAAAHAQNAPPREIAGRAVRAAHAPVIDGRDDDPVWATAPVMTGFRQFDPGEDAPTSFRTEFRVAYDDRFLYVYVRAFDPAPDSIAPLLSRRDVKTASDQIKIIIDAYKDRRTGVELAVNPAGVKRDYSIYSDVTEDATWDGVWDVAVRIDSLGWAAEFAVPFSQLRYNDQPTHEFGFGVWRDIARRNQRDSWPAYRTSARTLMSQMGTITGIERIAPARHIELLPYAVVKSVPGTNPLPTGNSAATSAGLDVKAGLGPAVTLDATVHPDFGQVEADPAVLNLSAFEIHFDERRPFFQEGAGLYACGGPCEGVFYTRRIGRTPQLRSSDADPVFTNITGAAKLTGRDAGGNLFGLVDAVTEQVRGVTGSTIEPRTNYLILRGVREMRDGQSQLGVEVTDVRRALDAATSPFLRRSGTTGLAQGYTRFDNDAWELNGYGAVNRVEGSASAVALTQLGSVHYYQRPDGEAHFDSTRTSLGGYVIGAGVKQVGGQVRYENSFRYATPGVEANDLGFVTLVNDASFRQSLDLRQVAPNDVFRTSFSTASLESHWTTSGLLAAQVLQLYTSASLNDNWSGAITGTLSDVGGTSCVSCARGGPALRQSTKHGIRFDLGGDPRPALVPRAVYRAGVSDDGRSWYRGGELGFDARVASRFSVTVGTSYDHVVNDQQWVANYGALFSDTTHYTFARLDQDILSITVRANWTATPALSFQFYGQPFVASGAYSAWRELASPRADAYAERFRPYGSDATPDGFNVKQFNSNAVVRWEYRPGSVMFIVWQQGRAQSDLNPGTFEARRDVSDLFLARPLNTVLLKLSYWMNP